MVDIKYSIHLIAEEIAEKKYGCEFYDLSEEKQSEVWKKAEQQFFEDLYDRADMMKDELKIQKEF